MIDLTKDLLPLTPKQRKEAALKRATEHMRRPKVLPFLDHQQQRARVEELHRGNGTWEHYIEEQQAQAEGWRGRSNYTGD